MFFYFTNIVEDQNKKFRISKEYINKKINEQNNNQFFGFYSTRV